MSNLNLIKEFEEIKKVGIIKDFKIVQLPNGQIDYEIIFLKQIPPEKVLMELDNYLAEKYGLIYV